MKDYTHVDPDASWTWGSDWEVLDNLWLKAWWLREGGTWKSLWKRQFGWIPAMIHDWRYRRRLEQARADKKASTENQSKRLTKQLLEE